MIRGLKIRALFHTDTPDAFIFRIEELSAFVSAHLHIRRPVTGFHLDFTPLKNSPLRWLTADSDGGGLGQYDFLHGLYG